MSELRYNCEACQGHGYHEVGGGRVVCASCAGSGNWPPPAVAAGGVTEALRKALDMCERYAEFIRRVPSANLEEHPYLPELEDVIEALAALAVRDEGIREGWQDISTVPKDGREVVLRVRSRAGVPGGTVVGHYMQGGHCIEDHPPIAAGWYFWGGTSFDLASEPTHWQPLPPPPSRGEGV